MPQVFGLTIDDERNARVARWLLRAHIAVLAVAFLHGIVSAIRYFVVKAAVEDVRAQLGYETNPTSTGTDATAVIFLVIAPLICPIGVFFCVRSGLQQNNGSLMQATCWFDACCTMLLALGIMSTMVNVSEYSHIKESAESFDCGGPGVNNTETCEGVLGEAADYFGVAIIMSIISMLVGALMFVVCGFGTYYANKAAATLSHGSVFVGAPPFDTRMGYVQNTPMVVGQPMGVYDGGAPWKGSGGGTSSASPSGFWPAAPRGGMTSQSLVGSQMLASGGGTASVALQPMQAVPVAPVESSRSGVPASAPPPVLASKASKASKASGKSDAHESAPPGDGKAIKKSVASESGPAGGKARKGSKASKASKESGGVATAPVAGVASKASDASAGGGADSAPPEATAVPEDAPRTSSIHE